MIAVSRGNNAVSYGVHNIHNAVNCDTIIYIMLVVV